MGQSSLLIEDQSIDTATREDYTVVNIKYTHEPRHRWSLWTPLLGAIVGVYNCTLSSRDFEIHLLSKASNKQVEKKETISGFLFTSTYDKYSKYCFFLPASPSSSIADNPEDFKKFPSQKLTIYQGKYKQTINLMDKFRRVSRLTVMTTPNFL